MYSAGIAIVATVGALLAGWSALTPPERRWGTVAAVVACLSGALSVWGSGGAAPRLIATAVALTAVAAWGHVLLRRSTHRTPVGVCEGLISSLAAAAAVGARLRADPGRHRAVDAMWALAILPVPPALAAAMTDPARAVAPLVTLGAATAAGVVLAAGPAPVPAGRRGSVRGVAFDPVLGLTSVVALAAAAGAAHVAGQAGALPAAGATLLAAVVDPGAAGVALVTSARDAHVGSAGTAALTAGVITVCLTVRAFAVAAGAGTTRARPLLVRAAAVAAAAWAAAGVMVAVG